jgi:tetratricopeptide (TPR) repeat protein
MKVEIFFLLALCCCAVARAGEGRLGWYSTSEAGASQEVEKQLQLFLAGRGLTFTSRQELFEILRRVDTSSGVLERAAAALEEGRQLHLGMELDKAAAAYQRCYQELLQGLAQYYRPGLLAEPLLQLGVAHFEAGRKEQAAAFFRQAWTFSPGLQLAGGYFSPRVRDFFARTTADLKVTSPSLIEPGAAARICQAAGLQGLLVVQQERAGEELLLRFAVFDCRQTKYLQLESAVVGGEEAARLLAERLFPACARLAGLPPAGEERDGGTQVSEGAAEPGLSPDAGQEDGASALAELDRTMAGHPDGGVEIPPEGTPPPAPWYLKHWWIWPVAAAIVGSAVALPLTVFRRDVVDVHVR